MSDLSPEFIQYMHLVEGGEKTIDRNTGRWMPYQDDAGKWTIGRGHLINGGKSKKGFEKGLTSKEVEKLFAKDISKARKIARRKIGPYDFDRLNQRDQELFTDFAFNLGDRFDDEFPNMTKAILAGDRAKAFSEVDRYLTKPDGTVLPMDHRNEAAKSFFFSNHSTSNPPGGIGPVDRPSNISGPLYEHP